MTNAQLKSPWYLSTIAIISFILVTACGPADNRDRRDGGLPGNDSGNSSTDGGQTGADAGPDSTPSVLSHLPASGAMNVVLNGHVSVSFSEAMNPATIDSTSFTVTTGNPATAVPGVVLYSQNQATFWPSARLTAHTQYTATVTTAVTSAQGVALPHETSWQFTTSDSLAASLPVQLGTAGGFVILAKSGISTVPASAITGNIAVSPAAASYITGFTLSADSTNVFATSSQVTGQVYAADYASPTPSNLTTAVGDMQIAFTDAAGRPPDFTELGAGDVGGMTLKTGVYQWGTGLLIPTDITLEGNATDVWIFQIAQDLTVANGVKVILAGGALPKNIFWQVSGKVELGTTSHFEGVVLTQTSATLATGASLNGRVLAQTAVELDANTIVQPAQ